MTDTELLPCPFCASRVVGFHHDGDFYIAQCAQCGAEVCHMQHHKALAAWNRRAPVTVAQAARVLTQTLDGDGWRVAVNTMAPILRADLDQSAWASVTELREAFLAALTALTGEDQR